MNKKRKFWKWGFSSLVVCSIAFIPLITTSCNYVKDQTGENNNDDKSNGSNNNSPNKPTGGDSGGGNTSDGNTSNGDQNEPDKNPTVVEPIFNTNIKVNGNINNLFNYDNNKLNYVKNIDQNISNYLQNNPNLVLKNYNELSKTQLSNIKINFKGNYPELITIGQNPYSEWIKGAINNDGSTIACKTAIFNLNNADSKMEVSSIMDFYTSLNPSKLYNIFEQIFGKENVFYKQYNIVSESQIGYSDGLFHINIKQTATDSNTIDYYDLAVPVSDFIFDINGKLSFQSDGIDLIETTEKIAYDIGVIYKQTKQLQQVNIKNVNFINTESFLNEMGWLNNNNSLNSTNIGNSLGIYNCQFFDMQLIQTSTIGIYTLNFNAKPNDNFVWDDTNNNQTKNMEITNVQVLLANAISVANQDENYGWGLSQEQIKQFNNNQDLSLPVYASNDVIKSVLGNQELLDRLANFLMEKYFDYFQYIKFSFESATITYPNDHITSPYVTAKVKLAIEPMQGHCPKDVSSFKTYGYFTFEYITNVLPTS